MVDGIGTISVRSLIEFAEASCSAYERPLRFAYHIENPPTRLLEADPAPSLTISESTSVSRMRPNALDVARPNAANPEAENPRPLPSTFGFLDSIRSLVLSAERPCFASTVVIVGRDFMQTEILSW